MVLRFFKFFRYLTPRIVRETIRRIGAQNLPGLASEMAYTEILALFPAILAIFTAIGLFSALKMRFVKMIGRLSEVVPTEAFGLIDNFSNEVSGDRNSSLFSVSFVLAIWIASSALGAAMRAMDQIHQIPPRQRRPYWKSKLIAIGLTIAAIILIIIATFLVFISDILIERLLERAAEQRDLLEQFGLILFQSLTWPLVLLIMSSVFAFIYRFGPSQPSPRKPIIPGAVLAAASWAVVSWIFRLYVSQYGNYNRVYGAVGAVIILMLWLYISSLIMLIGDQLNVVVGEKMQIDSSKRRTAPYSRKRIQP
ncbi:MAG: YihY/virulence factor BrkB family protein [Cyanobacteria bacterium P01_A01_bin.37]